MKDIMRTVMWVCIFSIAMAALEAAVVVYLRALYYPEGFTVAFKIIDEDILKVELLRELATLVMLLSVGYLSGYSFKDRLAYFLLAFAIWDIFYYTWLNVLIDWPSSIMEWDILFLIPFTWLGPVLAPLLCSLTMIGLALVLLTSTRGVYRPVWMFLIGGSIIILYTFMEDYGRLIIENGLLSEYPQLLKNPDFLRLAADFFPERFNWLLFSAGELLLLAGIYLQYRGGFGLTGFSLMPRLANDENRERS